MKLKSVATMAVISALGVGPASANILFDLYAGATVGMGGATLFADGHTESDGAQSYGAVAGIDIPAFRFELEYDFLNANDSKMHVGMLNAYFKVPSLVVKPYLGVGVGTVFSGDYNNTDIDTSAAYQGMLGLTFDIPIAPIKIDAEARAMYAPNIFEAADIKPDILHYDLRVKLRYVF